MANNCWQPLNIAELPKTKKCRLCGQDSHLLPLNENIVFWIHQGDELAKCTDIAFKTSYLKGLKTLLEIKKQQLQKQFIKSEDAKCVNHA